MQNSYLDNSHTIKIARKDITVRIRNDADPVLLTRTFRLLEKLSCWVIISGLEKIYIICGYTDMRKSMDGLCSVIEDQLKISLVQCSLPFLQKKAGQNQSLVPRTGWLRSDL